jgi:hypothetical protein
MKRLVATILLAPLAAVAATSDRWCYGDEPFPTEPFELTATPRSLHLAPGETLDVQYELRNTSDSAVTLCVEGWADHCAAGSKGDKCLVSKHLDGFSTGSVVRIPARSALSWNAEITLIDVGTGPVRFQGLVASSWCGWKGEVKSSPIELLVEGE